MKYNNQRIVQLTYYQITFWGLCIQCLAPWCCDFESRLGWCVQHYVIKFSVTYDRSVFSTGLPVSSTNKTDRHDITEVLLKVALNTIKQKPNQITLRQVSFSLIYINMSSFDLHVSSLHRNVNKSIMLSLTV